MPPVKGQMFRYSEADMESAIEECRRGLQTATAAKKFGVPRVTLLNKVKGKTPIKRKMGRNCYITEDIEKMLVTWVKAMVKRGFPIGKENLQDSVKKIVDDLKLETPFKEGRPGKRWYSSFLKRHPDLIPRQPQNLTVSRASVCAGQIKNWFEEVNSYLNENNYSDILKEPRRVFNMDETAFFLNPKGSKVLASKGEKSVYQQVNADEKECFTVLLGGNAAGDVLPPMVMFKYARIPKELSMSVPESWGVGRSDSGWMTMESFYEYICNIFNKWLDANDVPRPVLLFIDGHTSHLSFHVSKFCSENGIILTALFPNATHLLQPMDVAVFRSLKGAWKTAVQCWRLENIDSPILRKLHFCPLLNKVLKDTLVPTIFQNGFRKCGLVPWNPDVVCMPEPPTNEITQLQTMAKIKELELGIKFLNKYIDDEKITQFKGCDEWVGANEDIGLFRFYKKVEGLFKESNQNLATRSETSDLTRENLIPEQCSSAEIILPLISDDPKTSSQEPDDMSQNPQNSMNLNSLIMPSTSIQNTNTPSKNSSDINIIIPSPFKRALFWPTPKENTKKRKKEKIPSVVSSSEWQKYYESKEKKKAEFEEEKKRRAEERKKKKVQNEDIRKLKTAHKLAKKIQKTVNNKKNKTDYSSDTSTDIEWQESGDSMDDITDEREFENNDEENEFLEQEEHGDEERKLKQSDYIVVNFPGKKKYHRYLCIVQKITRKDIEVMAMVCCDPSKTIFKENDKDISIIRKSQIVEVLNAPKMIITGDRIKYKFDVPLQVDG